MEKEKNSNRFKVAIIAMCAALLVVGGVVAFLTDKESKTNEFTIVTSTDFDQTGWLTEPNWNPTNGQGITPGQVIVKDPTIQNMTSTDAWMFIKVEIPQSEVQLTTDGVAKKQNLFTFTPDGGFVQVKDGAADGVFVYALGDGNSASKPNAKGTLFQNVTFVDVKNGTACPETANIEVTGYAIQATAGTTAAQAWGEVEKAYPVLP